MPLDAILLADSGTGPRRLRLSDYLAADAAEAAAHETYAWIKGLRHARVAGDALRQRFTYRGDSLWWFAELYLHKDGKIQTLFEAIRAAEALIDAERPLTIGFERADRAVRTAIAAAGSLRNIRCPRPAAAARRRLAAMEARSAALALAAMLSPRRGGATAHGGRPVVAAFVHRAFWRSGAAEDAGAESYIGPVLQALEARLPVHGVRYVGLGPPTNFRARRWWRPVPGAPRRIAPIEQLAPRSAMRGSWTVWRARHRVRRELVSSEDIRSAAVIRGCDCWTIVREALEGIALLQFPWSARAMDEAAAALDALRPAVAVTYAEAGGWGRALALEARRKHVPLAGLQHGFIYRHWLNYRHEPDEMEPPVAGSRDGGFPRPTLTLVFDEYAAQHLTDAGRFPCDAVAVTGSPRLDALAEEASALSQEAIDRTRRLAGATGREPLIVIVSKYSEIRRDLPALIAAIGGLPGVRAVIKTHPAETPAPYEAAAAHAGNVRVLPAATPLAPLLRGAQLVVTVNSTVAIDSLVLGVPALTVGGPNNLTPFVAAGAMAGTAASEEIGQVIRRVLYDPGFRQQLGAAAAAVADRYRIAADGRAAERSATAILGLAASDTNTQQ